MSTSAVRGWALRPATPEDLEVMTELRAVVMRPDLERLGRYDAHRVRQRLRDSYAPEHTSVVVAGGGTFAGCVTLRPAEDGWWLENFLLAPELQGGGIGTTVLTGLLARADAEGVAVRLQVLQGSPARALYERHGFALEREDPVDAYMVRLPQQ
ncbi:GNAT family N-acetyltransferase [Streptomyces sp. NPDC086010]|uniref:GNAT family N-acetyltransferase n=1 Tax=Streptomyces sp. NPDC086010 TaxID=3365745 RepID=UPI0037D610E1